MSAEQYRIHIYQRGAPITVALILINCVIYGIGIFLRPADLQLVLGIFGLSVAGMQHHAYWQLATYAFLHGNLLHLSLNMIGLWFVGREVEIILGGGKYLFLYLMGGIVGGLAQVLLIGTRTGVEIVGASGGVFAVMIAFTTLYPNVLVTALIFFVLPLRMRAKFLGIGVVLLSILFWMSGIDKGTAHVAHLGGCAVGFLLGLLWKKGLPPFPPGEGMQVEPERPKFQPRQRLTPPTEIEKVLNKIVTGGFDSLSAEERHLLEKHRNQLSRGGDNPK